MATYLIDLDGVFFKYGTMEPTENAIREIALLHKKGHQIYFITSRKYRNNSPPHLSIAKTKRYFQAAGIKYAGIIPGSPSPRFIINDEEVGSYRHIHNASFPRISVLPLSADSAVQAKVYYALTAIAWTAWKYEYSDDADDYVQTLLTAKCLIRNNGFNHRQVVRKYRETPAYMLHGKNLLPGGVSLDYRGQVSKLLSDPNPLYVSRDGISDGSAMKVLPIAAFYFNDFNELVRITDLFTRITHNTPDARMAAQLIALRYRQIFLGQQGTGDTLLKDLERSAFRLGIAKDARFFIKKAHQANQKSRVATDTTRLLADLVKTIGLDHLAWSTPITSCFMSYRTDINFPEWIDQRGEKEIICGNTRISASSTSASTRKEYVNRLRRIGKYDEYMRSHGHHWCKSIDTDTFFSITFGLVAAQKGIDSILSDLPRIRTSFQEDFVLIARLLTFRTDTSTGFTARIDRWHFVLYEFFRSVRYRMTRVSLRALRITQWNLGIKRRIRYFYRKILSK